jgi:hypothetical protein
MTLLQKGIRWRKKTFNAELDRVPRLRILALPSLLIKVVTL